ncbi:MAG TPA: M1 family metallopeptidase [Vicinamibacterales bacterium]|nr:M1 family metallopeptidase [Vicinamibacterales bacterium]
MRPVAYFYRSIAVGPILCVMLACSPKAATPPVSGSSQLPRDMSTYANIDIFITKHLVLDLTADFDSRTLHGTAELRLERRDPSATEVVLDSRDLDVRKIEASSDGAAWADATYRFDPATPAFGSALRVTVPPDADRVRITYATPPSAKGLQWLTPAQTSGKKQPFLFSQAQAIQARSFIPIQDTPAVRMTYDATIRVPKELVAVMAAEMTPGEKGSGVFHFHMPQPIPSYLIAIAIGDLAFQPMSERTGVWAEPAAIAAAAKEFEDTEQMIKTTEALYGPYRWGRYDLLVLPPSFPFGGMENPRVTFATPTVIVGDKSLVALVAHELAHSWSGNLVTNATWADFWLNEGFTTYLERRIVEAVYGKKLSDMERIIGLRDLGQARADLTVAGDRTLQPTLADRDPDDAYSVVPYELGALFLSFLEERFGRDTFDRFLRRWFDEHAFQSVTTAQFLEFLSKHLLSTKPGAVTDQEIQEWLHTESIPSFAVMPKSDALEKVERARDAWLRGESVEELVKTSSAWSTQEWVHFIDALPRKLDGDRLSTLDRRLKLTDSPNAEIAHVWFRLAIANRYTAAFPAMERYMIRIGRRKLIVALYRDLATTTEGKALATRIYGKAREGYHPVAQSTVDGLLK